MLPRPISTRYDAAPLLIINSERLNFVDDPAHIQLLLDRVGFDARAPRILQSDMSAHTAPGPRNGLTG